MPNKNVPINYSARDFSSIKESLVQHAKRYYPNTFKDFSEAGFGSLMLDTVSYIGDILSFYLDYQANENFIDTANEYNNVEKLARQMGYKELEAPTSHGIATFFILVPAAFNGLGPNLLYKPILKRGSVFSTSTGNQFILTEDVIFNLSDNQIVVARTNPQTGLPTFYAVKAYGKIVSGIIQTTQIQIDSFQRFKKVKLPISGLAEILSVTDSDGNEYFQVDHLTQDVIYRPITNRNSSGNTEDASAFLRPYVVPRRFTLEKYEGEYYLQFGQGQASSNRIRDTIADPSTVSLKVYGKNYVSDDFFDPTNLIYSDKLGIVPANTTLTITVRTNTTGNSNASTAAIKNIVSAVFEFNSNAVLDANVKNGIKNSLEVTNEEPIVGDVRNFTSNELKVVAMSSYAAQSRAVTREDYRALVYKMPSEYGKIRRVNVVRDNSNTFRRNLNMYVISNDQDGFLVKTNSAVKQNLKMWINKNRMINDTIDILDAKIINYGIDFTVVADLEVNKFDLLNNCKVNLITEFERTREIGESLFNVDIVRTLKEVKGVLDVVRVKFVNKSNEPYSQISYDFEKNTSADGRYINAPENVIFELKFPSIDIKGVVL